MSAPYLSMEDAWDAAEKVGMAEDIRLMPMGMHTFISEGSGDISGGQKQRLMIARAIVGRPKILIMDEAASALDNLTQKTVTDSLDALDCTRIVIAHRLSTIRSCDRILALDRGKIVESGSYDELMERDGFFADLVRRQQIDEG
jgi:ABC-type bacteriocin/lantibiotic exporter with double-glycine peptidase domain